MKNIRLHALLLALTVFSTSLNAQSLGDIWNRLGAGTSKTNNSTSTSPNTSGLSNMDMSNGLKEALKIGAQNASQQLSAKDGFLKNAAVKILLPPQVQEVERTLRSVGMGSLVDQAIVSLNRAAEDAAGKAAPIFVNAITGITIQDGLSILKGGNNAATTYLQSKTTSQLTAAFRPVIQTSLNKVGAEKLWETVFKTYNQLPLIREKVNPDLTGYVTERALSGLFTTIAQEELKIRTDPAAQVTSILKKVFGNK